MQLDKRKRKKILKIGKKLSFANDMLLYVDSQRQSPIKLLTRGD